jgi:hypothetical protein
MTTYECRVRLPAGGFTSVHITADSQYHARQLGEAMYGSGNFIAVLCEVR